ncbi:MAG: hypothetical protein PHF26_02770 [Candidatus Gracilibacteria bacterium]|nr:hypothetical protein [Candidatus Gracilibacteria bacterium]
MNKKILISVGVFTIGALSIFSVYATSTGNLSGIKFKNTISSIGQVADNTNVGCSAKKCNMKGMCYSCTNKSISTSDCGCGVKN